MLGRYGGITKMTATDEAMHKFADCPFCAMCSKSGRHVLSDKEKAKYRRVAHQILSPAFCFLNGARIPWRK